MSNPEEVLRSLGEGGATGSDAMFSERWIDNVPREVQMSDFAALEPEAERRAAWVVLGVLVGFSLFAAGMVGFGVLVLGWWAR